MQLARQGPQHRPYWATRSCTLGLRAMDSHRRLQAGVTSSHLPFAQILVAAEHGVNCKKAKEEKEEDGGDGFAPDVEVEMERMNQELKTGWNGKDLSES